MTTGKLPLGAGMSGIIEVVKHQVLMFYDGGFLGKINGFGSHSRCFLE